MSRKTCVRTFLLPILIALLSSTLIVIGSASEYQRTYYQGSEVYYDYEGQYVPVYNDYQGNYYYYVDGRYYPCDLSAGYYVFYVYVNTHYYPIYYYPHHDYYYTQYYYRNYPVYYCYDGHCYVVYYYVYNYPYSYYYYSGRSYYPVTRPDAYYYYDGYNYYSMYGQGIGGPQSSPVQTATQTRIVTQEQTQTVTSMQVVTHIQQQITTITEPSQISELFTRSGSALILLFLIAALGAVGYALASRRNKPVLLQALPVQKYCMRCRSIIPGNTKFCPDCGAPQ